MPPVEGTPYHGPPLRFDDDDDDKKPGQPTADAGDRSGDAPVPPTGDAHAEPLGPLQQQEREQAEKAARSLIRRRQLVARLRLGRLFAVLPYLLVVAGYILPLVLPIPPAGPFYSNDANNGISKGTYVDENALQPGQAYTYFNYNFDVPYADQVADRLTEMGTLQPPEGEHAKNWLGKWNDEQRAYLAGEFSALGMRPYMQPYTFSVPSNDTLPNHVGEDGTNLFARFSPPRTDAREALVLCAPWYTGWTGRNPNDPDALRNDWGTQPAAHPDQERRVNVRGIATVLAMARYLASRPHSYLSRDYYFLISDGHLAGAQAWLVNYFRTPQGNLNVTTHSVDGGPSDIIGGSVLWNALAVEYPSDSFRTIEVLHEGLNGQLPNMDALNAAVRVAEQVGASGVSVPSLPPSSVASKLISCVSDAVARAKTALESRMGYEQKFELFNQRSESPLWSEYAQRDYVAATERIWRQWALQASGTTTGVHGLFTRYHVDAVTVRAVPATGPFGFFHMGRIVEGTLRSYNNLLERLHHSQFFYLLLSSYRFVPFGVYLPAALLVAVGLSILALRTWAELGTLLTRQQVRDFNRCAHFIVKEFGGRSGDDAKAKAEANMPLRFSALDVASDSSSPDHYARELFFLATSLCPEGVSAETIGPVQRAIARTRTKIVSARRPVGVVTLLVAAAHGAGYLALLHLRDAGVSTTTSPVDTRSFQLAGAALVLPPPVLALLCTCASTNARATQLGSLMHTVALLHTGVIIAVTSVLNFPLALMTALLLGLPLLTLRCAPSPSPKSLHLHRARALLRAVAWSLFGAPQAVLLAQRSLLLPSTLQVALGATALRRPAVASILAHVLASAPALAALASSLGEAVRARLWEWHVLGTHTVPYVVLAYSVVTTEAALGAWLDLLARSYS